VNGLNNNLHSLLLEFENRQAPSETVLADLVVAFHRSWKSPCQSRGNCLRFICGAGDSLMPPRYTGKKLRATEGFIDDGGVRIYHKTLGSGVPLLLLHGGPGADHSDFSPREALAKRCQLILIDERGSGRSERLADPKCYTLDNMVKDIERVRSTLDSRGSWCWGTPSAAYWRRPMPWRHPQRILGWCSLAPAREHAALIGTFAASRKRLRIAASATRTPRKGRHFPGRRGLHEGLCGRPRHGRSPLTCTQ